MLRSITIITLAAVLAGCAGGPTPYAPAGDSRYGLTEQQVESDRFRISFSGNSLTDRDTVETYLLYRAAELTLAQGYDYFRLAQRDTETETRLVGSSTYDRFGLQYRYYHPAYGWYGRYDPFWNDVNIREVTRYEAMAEIVLGRGAIPDTPDAFNAREVVQNLGPRVQRPSEG
ncbi:CC0125/CC1285 family lipoprotein [Oceanicaulis sp.]|uniref:CC0125/CC1285 family lipoprotein n=1 Tax=Oceanicaulis sp. TaxID=1924941 RepID=UPI003F6E9EB6